MKANHTLVLALLVTLVAGCGDKKSAQNGAAPDVSAPAVNSFQGTLRAKHWVHIPLNTFEITYTIGRDEIKRETVSKNVVDRLLAKLAGPTIAGVICRPTKDEVVLYCEAIGKKRFCKMSLSAYRELCALESLSKPGVSHGFGHLFLDLPEESKWTVVNAKDQVTVAGYKCDRHVLSWEDSVQSTTITTDHSPQIQVPRERLLLVEPGMPASITGFPLIVRRVETLNALQAVKAKPEDDRMKRWLAKAAKLASDGLKKVFESGMEVLNVDASAPLDSAFDLPAGYTEVATPETFRAEFSSLESSGGDWDD